MTKNLSEILNLRRWDANVTLSGQPSETQLADLAETGVKHVINLGPYDNKGALADEPGCLAALGLGYTYIPVDFTAPTDADFEAFASAFDKHKDTPLHVHCIYNARVSAFMLRYALEGRGGSTERARALMESIWRPGADWAAFLGEPARLGRPNTYAGEDY